MITSTTINIAKKIHPHVLPHFRNNWRANLLKSPSLITYIVFLLGLTLVFNFISVVRPGILGFASNITKQDIFTFTNNQRAELGLSTLSENSKLSAAAQSKANHMFSNNYWAHVAPDGTTPWQFIKDAGYKYLSAGENLARDFDHSSSVVNAWIASPSHRENIVNSAFSEIGIGVVNGILDGKETTLVVQMFAKPVPISLASGQTPLQPVSQVTIPSPSPKATPKVLPQPTPTVTKIPAQQPELTITPQPQIAPTTFPIAQIKPTTSSKPFINSFKILRGVSLAIVFLLALLIIADLIIAKRARFIRSTGHSIAHLGILLILLLAIWYTNSGLIL